MRHKTFPKNKEKKLKETIQELKARINQLEKENKFLNQELQGRIQVAKPKSKVQSSFDEWRIDFLKRYRKEVLGKE